MKTRIKFLIILIAAAAASLIAGCRVGRESYQDFVKRNEATCHITYHANGGQFETTQGIKEMYYKPGTCLINIGVDELYGSNIDISKDGYVFSGWCYAATDESGKIIYEDEENGIVKTGKAYDFTHKLGEDESFDLYAVWTLDVLIEIHLVSDTDVTLKDGDAEKVYKSGDIIAYRTFGKGTQVYLRDEAPVTGVGYTFLQMYEDENCETPFAGTAIKPMGDDATNLVLYAKYVTGDWTVVKDRSGVTNMFREKNRTKNFYIFDDIDCGGLTVSVELDTNCVIEGNGHTISNLVVNRTGITNATYSLFGTFGADTKISNVTFKGLNVTFSTRDRTYNEGLYLVCSEAKEGAEFENFKIEDAVLNVNNANETTTVDNIQKLDGAYETDNWLFGGEETDDAFLANHGGIILENISLNVNENLILQK